MTRPLGVGIHDDKVRTRLAEIRAAAGVPHSQISMEVLYFLPERFIEIYGTLFTKAVKSDGGESARAAQQQSAAEVGKSANTAAATNQKRFKRTFVVLDEKALDVKTKIDKRLRQIARDIEVELAGGEGRAEAVTCNNCGMFLQRDWRFCPRDGSSQSS